METNKNNKGIFPPIVNSMLNRASGASQVLQQENNRQRQLNQASASNANNLVSGSSALSTGSQNNNKPSQAMSQQKPQVGNNRVSSSSRPSSQARNTPNKLSNKITNAGSSGTDKSQFIVRHNYTPNLDFRYGTDVYDKSAPHGMGIPMNNSVGGGAMMSASNEVGPKELNGLVDVIMTSDMDRPVKRQLLKVILNNIKTITDREDKEINDMRDKYTAGAYMSSLMPQVQNQMMPLPPTPNPYMIQQPQMPYMMPQPPNPYMMPQMMPAAGMGNLAMPYYMGSQQPNMQVEMLGNKINVLQMEMADLTRHLKDYTRRYMDVMREDDMQRIKSYIEELSNVKETVEEAKGIANTMGPTPEELVEEEESANKGLIDKASDTVKNGLATVTNAVNSIGSKLGLVKEPAANNQPAPANNTPDGSQSANSQSAKSNKPPASNKSAEPQVEEPDSEGENMVDLSDYEIPTSGDEDKGPTSGDEDKGPTSGDEDKGPTSGDVEKNSTEENKDPEDDLDAAIDQLNKASNEALTGNTQNTQVSTSQATGSRPANKSAGNRPANKSAGNRPSNTPMSTKLVNTANALSRTVPGNTVTKPQMKGGAVDTEFFKTFKKLLANKGKPVRRTKKNK